MAEKLIFAQTIEGLIRSLGPSKLTPQLVEGLLTRGVDPTRPLVPAYPKDVFIAVVKFLASELHPDQPLDRAVALLGRGFVDAYGQTMVGTGLLAMIRLIGPKRTLERVTREFRTGNNYSDTRLTALGETEYDLWVNEALMPGWYIGILSRGLELAGAKAVNVVLTSQGSEGGIFRITWNPS